MRWNFIRTFFALATLFLFLSNPISAKTNLEKKSNSKTKLENDSNNTGMMSSAVLVLYPNGKEQLIGGTSVQVKWASSEITYLRLEISYDSKNTWQLLKDSLVASTFKYDLIVPDVKSTTAFIRLSDISPNGTASDVSNNAFTLISSSQNVIVVVGSSTAAGTGPSTVDSAWVWRYRKFINSLDSASYVFNLAVGGYTTYDVMPDQFVPPAGRPQPKKDNNITKAFSYNPDAIILNLPSNDANNNYSYEEQIANFDSLIIMTERRGVDIWLTTTQPRNFSVSQRNSLIQVKDSLISKYTFRIIDFWTGIANEDGTINSAYNSGDGIHLNNAGHRILVERVKDKNIIEKITSVNENGKNKKPYNLLFVSNYPNPFNPSTTIKIDVSFKSEVIVEIYDILGRKITQLFRGNVSSGSKTLDWNAGKISSGIYFIRTESKNEQGILLKYSKLIVLK